MEDREKEREILKGIPGAADDSRILEMTDRGDVLGWVAVSISAGTLYILKLYAQGYDFSARPEGEAAFVLDTLMRSAASYGETNGAQRIETVFPDFFNFFKLRGFDTDVTCAFTPMSTIVKYE